MKKFVSLNLIMCEAAHVHGHSCAVSKNNKAFMQAVCFVVVRAHAISAEFLLFV